MRRLTFLAMMAASWWTLAACSADAGPETEAVVESSVAADPTTSTTTTAPPDTEPEPVGGLPEIAVTYLQDIAARRPTTSAAPDSPASMYANYLVESRLVYGLGEPTEAIVDQDSAILRTRGEDDITIDNIQVSSAGVEDFDIAGSPMSERIFAAEPATASDIAVSGLIYRSASGVRVVMIEARNESDRDDLLLFWESAFTSNADGRQESPIDAATPEIAPGATAVAMFIFDEVRTDTSGQFLLSYAHRGPGDSSTDPPRLTVEFP